jgi:hypothetical protein
MKLHELPLLWAVTGLSTVPLCAQAPAADRYRDEPVVFERVDTALRMHADGTGDTATHIVVRVQSEGAARQFSVLSLSYASANSTGSMDFVRVHKSGRGHRQHAGRRSDGDAGRGKPRGTHVLRREGEAPAGALADRGRPATRF